MTNAPDIDLARVYDDARASRGARLLVDRVWPRGIGKDARDLDDWIREVAPTTDLRKWFGHDRARWDAFRRRYRAELDANTDAVEHCLSWSRKGPVVLLHGGDSRESPITAPCAGGRRAAGLGPDPTFDPGEPPPGTGHSWLPQRK